MPVGNEPGTPSGGQPPLVEAWASKAWEKVRRSLTKRVTFALRCTRVIAGMAKAASRPMITTTIMISTSVNARVARRADKGSRGAVVGAAAFSMGQRPRSVADAGLLSARL